MKLQRVHFLELINGEQNNENHPQKKTNNRKTNTRSVTLR